MRKLIPILALLLVLIAPRLGMAQATVLPPGEQCFAALTPTSGGVSGTGTGMIGLLGTITGGSGGTTGTYGGVTLTGSVSGQSNATANITVSGGVVTAVAILNPGTQYVAGDVLTATPSAIGNVSGFSVPVSSVTINSSLAGGSVTYYIPSTNTYKQTWKNSTQTTLNANPVTLDANGCAIVYGSGIYRQVLMDSLGDIIWDQLTASTNQNNPFWAGQAGGTPNVITVVDPSFAGVDGSVINFIPLYNNTGATTITPSGTGSAIPVVKDTTAGPAALTGAPSEIVATSGGTPNIVSVAYSATQNNFHILNNVIQSASGSSAPLCGASNLQITNNASTPNAVINLTADQIVMQSASGLVVTRSSVSLTLINISTGTSTAAVNGMDGEAPGTSAWLDVFAIDNGAAPAGLVSLAAGNGKSPTFPSGYSYKCFLGSMRVDSAGNLFRTNQRGSFTQRSLDGSTNNTAYPTLATGSSGTISTTTFTGTATSTATCVPPTATRIGFVISSANATGQAYALAPNSNFDGYETGLPPPISGAGNTNTATVKGEFLLESTNVYYAAGGSSILVQCDHWVDSVNAN